MKIDGSKGEGGGQILRNAISYACILRKKLLQQKSQDIAKGDGDHHHNNGTVEISSIRAKRSKPGLKAQHLTGLRLAVEICGGELQGDELSSTQILYYPPENTLASSSSSIPHAQNEERQRIVEGDIGTAGSICLLLQTALPCALFGTNANSTTTLNLIGGTNADLAPQIDYTMHVLMPTLWNHFSIPTSVRLHVQTRGFYPLGGGKVIVPDIPSLCGQVLTPITLTERGTVCDVYIRTFHAGKVPKWVAQTMADKAVQLLFKLKSGTNKNDSNTNLDSRKHDIGCSDKLSFRNVDAVEDELNQIVPKIEVVSESNAHGNGSGILIIAKTTTNCIFGASSLGKQPPRRPRHKKLKMNEISSKQQIKITAAKAVNELKYFLDCGGCLDDWLQDQIILFMALADGKSEIITGGLTLHTRTAISVAQQMTGASFKVEKMKDMSYEAGQISSSGYGQEGYISGIHRITCQGISWGK